MQRRRFLGLAALSAASSIVTPATGVAGSDRIVRCRVAGLVYQDVDVASLRHGQPVVIRREQFQGQPCYRVLDQRARTLGFIPRPVIPVLEWKRIESACLSRVRPHAVPWRKAEVDIVFAAKV